MEQTHVFFRPQTKYPYGLTEEKVREAFDIYSLKITAEIINEIQREFPLIDIEEDTSLLDLLMSVISKSITKGMELSVNHMDVLQYYRDRQKEQDKPKYNVTQYDFEEGKGVSGVLFPNGEFIKCGNAEHYMVVEDIDFEVQKQCVYFSSFLSAKDGVVSLSPFGTKAMTDAQIHWIDMNIRYFDASQKDMYKMLR
jgi:hypothetical protein